MELKDYRAFSWVDSGLTYEVIGTAFYRNNKLVCPVDVWNSTKTRIVRKDEILYSKIEEKYSQYLTAKKA